MTEYHLKLPFSPEKLNQFFVGDVLFLTGIIITARDQAHARFLEALEGKRQVPFPPQLVHGNAIFHSGPLVKSGGENKYIILSAGPTTSERMEGFMEGVSRYLRPSFIIGKGGFSKYRPRQGMPIYLAFPGGCGALAAETIKDVKGVYWEDLGMPEAVWILEVEDFGPNIVVLDLWGNSL